MLKRFLSLMILLSLLCCTAFAEKDPYDTGSCTFLCPDGWTATEDNRVISVRGAEGAIVLVINTFGAYTAQQVCDQLLPGIRDQLALSFTDIAFSEKGSVILCGEREAVRYAFTADGWDYRQYIVPVGEDLWYLTASAGSQAQAEQLIASITEK